MKASVETCLGLPTPFPIGEAVYQVSPWSYEIQAAFSTYLKTKAAENHLEMVRALGLAPAERTEAWQALQRDFATGAYSFGSGLVLDAISNDRDALAHLLWLQLREQQPKLAEGEVQEWTHDPERRSQCLAAVFGANPQMLKPTANAEKAAAPASAAMNGISSTSAAF